jgi:penicillin-binding protein 1A
MTLCKIFLKWFAILTLVLLVCSTVVGYFLYSKWTKDLPDVNSLRNVQYQTPFSIYTKDHALIAQFGEKKRTPISINKIPQQLINAFLAAEDDRYYSHPGVDYKSLVRAAVQLWLTGKKKQGASTITMQVIRNFLLTREKTYNRKVKEIILSLQMERTFSKSEILELYLNIIYMGHSAYGVVAAAETYYDKDLSELTLAEQAMIAGLPKAPSDYNPVTNPTRATQRRDYILRRMAELGYASQTAVDEALKQVDTATVHIQTPDFPVPYIAEMVRQEILEKYGEEAYTSGMKVYTTIDKNLQTTASQALRNTLHLYDKRHGNRDLPYQTLTNEDEFKQLPVIGDTYPARIVAVQKNSSQAILQDNTLIEIPTTTVQWRKSHTKIISARLNINDIVRVRALKDNTWQLTRIPDIQGAFVSLNPMNGAILALEGGFDFEKNTYNRATQSKRQPGSGFKPIIYTTALEEGFTVASVINDSPIVITSGTAKDRAWHPQNYSNRFYGPTPIRTALTHSRNIVAIRLLQEVGIDKAIATAIRFGFQKEQLPYGLSLALGSGYASPLQMAGFYSVFANGGFLVKPYLIERIENDKGKIIFQATPDTACPLCKEIAKTDKTQPTNFKHSAKRVISPQISFLMNSLLRDVVQKGTATDAKVLGRTDLAGKTGTTNDQRDAWFNGFTPSIVATAWVGFDSAKSLGRDETGGKAALPMWIDFMRTALKNTKEMPFTPPAGIVKRTENGISDFFIKDQAPRKVSASAAPPQRESSSSSASTKHKHRSNGPETHEGKTVEELF